MAPAYRPRMSSVLTDAEPISTADSEVNARALEIIAGSDDYDALTAERYGCINRAIPDAELDAYVDAFARRLASFDAGAVAAAKRLVGRHAPGARLDDYRQTLGIVRDLLRSAAGQAR